MSPHLTLLLKMLAGWMNRHQQMAIDYLMEKNKVLRELHGDKRLNFTNEQRKRLAWKGRKLGLNGLRKVATLVTPETILAWHPKLVALKYTASDFDNERPDHSGQFQRCIQQVQPFYQTLVLELGLVAPQ